MATNVHHISIYAMVCEYAKVCICSRNEMHKVNYNALYAFNKLLVIKSDRYLDIKTVVDQTCDKSIRP